LAEGLNPSVAKNLAENHSIEEIQRQIDWIDARNPKSRGGLLKMAIEQNFEAPRAKAAPRSTSKSPATPGSNQLLSQIENQLDRDAHQQRHLPAYLDFLKCEEARIQHQAPDRYASFQTSRENERRSMANKPWVDEAYLDKFSSEAAFLKALQIHFHLQDFWQWDRAINPTPFESIAARMSISSSTSELASR